MRYVEVNGVKVSAIGVGCWQFGSKEWGYGDDYARRTARDIVHRALDLGVNLIDTAEIYGMGESERIVGRAIADRRDQVFLATKLFPVLPIPPVVEWRAVESAGRLRVTEIDLYQVHWPNPLAPNAPTMKGMRTLQEIGLVRHVGVSNFNLLRWRTAERMLGSPVLSNQVQYSLAVRKPDRELVPYAQSNDRLIIAYSPLAQGLLGGRYDVDHPPPPGVRTNNPLFLPDNLEKAAGLLGALREIAAAHEATPAQVALAWVIRRPNVVAIPGASSVEQLEANVAAADLELTDDEDARLTDESDRFDPTRGIGALPGLLAARQAAKGDQAGRG
ncbi:MAG TPA: aldo/keto reductase [Acidimicrobiales bacterium]|nr:aldo/keto reductase [Acidimicrobiales bacterium]